MLGTFDIGSKVQVTGTFRNLAGTLTDPSAVVCTVRDPAGTVTTPAATQSGSVGIWNATVDLTGATPGLWRVRFSGTGTVQAAEEDTFYVEPSYVLSQEP